MNAVSFTIPGVPQQQGSKRLVRTTDGRAMMIDANDTKLKSWRSVAMTTIADHQPAGEQPRFMGPVQVTMVAYFPRPKGHYGTGRNAAVLKPNAPIWYSSAPDADKITRALGDVLTQSGLILDDRLIVSWDGSKVYGQPRMDVTVSDAAALAIVEALAEPDTGLYDNDLLGVLR